MGSMASSFVATEKEDKSELLELKFGSPTSDTFEMQDRRTDVAKESIVYKFW